MPKIVRPTVSPVPGPTVLPSTQAKKTGLSPQTNLNQEAKRRYDQQQGPQGDPEGKRHRIIEPGGVPQRECIHPPHGKEQAGQRQLARVAQGVFPDEIRPAVPLSFSLPPSSHVAPLVLVSAP